MIRVEPSIKLPALLSVVRDIRFAAISDRQPKLPIEKSARPKIVRDLVIEIGHDERGSPITEPVHLFERKLDVIEPMKIGPIDDGRAKVGT